MALLRASKKHNQKRLRICADAYDAMTCTIVFFSSLLSSIQSHLKSNFQTLSLIPPSSFLFLFPASSTSIRPNSARLDFTSTTMKVPSRISLSVPRALPRPQPQQIRPLHQSIPRTANVAPIVGTGPPPEPPTPAARNASERLERRRKHAELLKTAKEIRSAQEAKANPTAARRFWKEVGVREVDG